MANPFACSVKLSNSTEIFAMFISSSDSFTERPSSRLVVCSAVSLNSVEVSASAASPAYGSAQ